MDYGNACAAALAGLKNILIGCPPKGEEYHLGQTNYIEACVAVKATSWKNVP